ncbi:glycine amidinotransferase [Amycolatopsis cihanbeyliensis]|uniref:Glycine amidinotransferase n=1 Tax=Amycolatopsis cihanbeyliensis TaxID=1128664 RepID=A0A542DEY3_AMYCI|nr:glycine amidinotransferase [Amycolatopsis cihanbeyliensis]TQJ01629.1 glycine amidinotransferase [Amycolatopsis cihanbeyliensis]
MTNRVVNSHDEWSHLEEVIVGTPYHLDYHDDSSFRMFFHDNLKDIDSRGVFYRRKPDNRFRDECIEDAEGLVNLLQKEGVTVRRPQGLDVVPQVATPNWRAPMGHALMSRDNFIIVGDEIIETSPLLRSRYFESELYKELFTEYFERGSKWTVAPRSRLLDRNFDYSYVLSEGYTGPVPDDPFYEIMFDGAQIMRLGTDLVFNVSTENHRMGSRWLTRHLGPEYKVHEVCVGDNHIDGKILPLRPGTLLVKEGVDLNSLPEKLQRWKIIRYEWFDKPVESEQDGVPFLASQSIGINVLSLDEERVVVQDIQLPLMRSLEKAGFTPIPCQWRHGRSLGGGFHCMTLDIRRRSEAVSYL